MSNRGNIHQRTTLAPDAFICASASENGPGFGVDARLSPRGDAAEVDPAKLRHAQLAPYMKRVSQLPGDARALDGARVGVTRRGIRATPVAQGDPGVGGVANGRWGGRCAGTSRSRRMRGARRYRTRRGWRSELR